MVEDGTNELEALLKNKAPKTLHWKYRIVDGDEHRSTAFTALYHGLRNYYHEYPELQFKDLEEFKAQGGLPYVYSYYKKRASRFGFSESLSAWTMFVLTRSAIRADSFEDFDFFIKEFKNKDMLNSIRLDRGMSLANYYIKYDKFEKAKDVYLELNKKNTSSAQLQNAIGDVFYLLEENVNAKTYYKKAVAIAETKKDPKLQEYLIDLEKCE